MVLLRISILVLSNAILAVTMNSEYDVDNLELVDNAFENFIINNKRPYNLAVKTHTTSQNLALINILDERNPSAIAEDSHKTIGNFANLPAVEERDTTMEEYRSVPSAVCKVVDVEPSDDAPDSFDWRDKNVVTPVKDQGMCKSDWIYGVTGNVEAQYAMKRQKLVNASEQQILDCQVADSNSCTAGSLLYAMQRLVVQGGVESESDYPYEAVVRSCRYEKNKILVNVTGCNYYSVDAEDDLKQLLFKAGPLAIMLGDIGEYKGGIVTVCDDQIVVAGALLVGYGTENGLDFWTIKHSMGTSFGEKGYSRIQRGRGCLGIGQMVISAIVD